MAGYKETFGANVDYAYSRGVTDIGNRLQQGAASLSGAGRGITAFAGQMRSATRGASDLATRMQDVRSEIKQVQEQMEDGIDKDRALRKLTRDFEMARKSAEQFRKQLIQIPFNAMEQGLGKIVKGLLKFNTGILTMAFDFLISSIKRVYELQERWTHAIGGFNMKLGGMTKGMAGATKAATQWSSTIRGLTNGSIEEGIQMFGEFTMAMGRTVKAGDGFSKLGVQMARGFGLGGSGAGQILKVFENIGMSAEDSAEAMKTTIKAAGEAGIPVNMLAEDLSKSTTYMARFGKEGQKTLIQGAAWARKYDIALDQLRQSVEGFDAFDDAAKSASKLNAMFGTMINSMDLMMEDDPAKRLDMIREQMLAQGMTYDKLSPIQRRYFSETLKLNEEQTAALLDAQNAGESYADFQAKAEKKQKQELQAKEMMQRMLVKTAQTMHAFGMSFDRVTMAIGRAIRPLLEVFGLAKKGDKDFKGFGEVMTNITNVVVKFFDSLAVNAKWQDFMRELAHDIIRAGNALKDFVMNGKAANLFGDMAQGMKKFYTMVRDTIIKLAPLFKPALDLIMKLSDYIKELSYGWAAMKALNTVGGPGLIGKAADLLGAGGGRAKGGLGRMAVGGGRLAMAGGAAAIGGMVGGAGAGAGAGIGSMIGSFMGPMGMVLGPIIGGLAGKAISWIFGSNKVKSELDKARDDLNKTIEMEKKKRESLNSILEAANSRQASQDKLRQSSNQILQAMEQAALKQKGKLITLNEQEAEMLRSRAVELSKGSKATKEMLLGLKTGSQVSAAELQKLVTNSQEYEAELQKLRDTTQKQAELEMARLQVSNVGQQKEALELTTKLHDMELKAARDKLKGMGGGTGDLYGGGDSGLITENKLYRDQEKLTADQKAAFFRKQSLDMKLGESTRKAYADLADRADVEAKINKLDMANIKDQKDLVQKQAEFFKQEVIIKLRQAIKSDAEFLNYQKSDAAKGKTIDQQMQDFLASGNSVLGSNPEIKQLLSEGLDFSGVTTKPTASPIMGSPVSAFNMGGPSMMESPTNFAAPTVAAPAQNTVQSYTFDVNLDGQKVGRGLMTSTTKGMP